ncbi:MAG: hypothetical protein LBB88_10560, partial [Planctomycetaceae bacterium]|nr:hypothetical protein [Planctomycetaceae bacterium]
MGGQRGRWGHWGRWGHTNLKTMINDSTVNGFLKEIFFSILSPEPLIPDFKQECPQCPLSPQRP